MGLARAVCAQDGSVFLGLGLCAARLEGHKPGAFSPARGIGCLSIVDSQEVSFLSFFLFFLWYRFVEFWYL